MGIAAVSRSAIVLVSLALAPTACTDDGGSDALFPADHASYSEVRDCRGPSGDHDLRSIRVLVSPEALAPYQMRNAAFPAGSVVLKEEHRFGDSQCQTSTIVGWTVMVKLAAGSSPSTLDWRWQKVDAKRKVLGEDDPRCITCHQQCGVAPDGYDATCTMP